MTAEELVAQWEKTGVAGVNLDELKALCAENRRLREATSDLQARLNTAIHQLNYWRSEFNEATRAENEAIADRADHWHALYGSEAHDIMLRFAAAIRARIAP